MHVVAARYMTFLFFTYLTRDFYPYLAFPLLLIIMYQSVVKFILKFLSLTRGGVE